METDSVENIVLESFMKLTANVIGIAIFHLETIDRLKSHLSNIYTSKNAEKAMALLPDLSYIISLFEIKSDLLPMFLARLEQKCRDSTSEDDENDLSDDSGVQDDLISKENLIKKVTEAVRENHVDFPTKSGRKRVCKKIVKYLEQENNPSVENYLNELKRRFSTDEDFKKCVKMIWDDLTVKEGSTPNHFERKLKLKYDDQVKKAVRIVAEVLGKPNLDHVSEYRRTDNYMNVLCYLTCQEVDWKTSGQKGLPPHHREIIRLKEQNESDHFLVEFVNKLVCQAGNSNCLARIEEMKKNDFNPDQPKSIPKGAHEGFNWRLLKEFAPVHAVSILGATFEYGLEMLPKLFKNPNMQRLIIAVDDVIEGVLSLNPYLLSFGVSGLYIAGVCIYNVWQCLRNGRSKIRAGKCVLDALVTTVAANLVGFGIAALITPAAPIGIVLMISAGIGIGASFILQPIVDRATQWIFNLPKEEALEKAFNVLGVSKNATDEEIQRAYRRRTRDYHEDKLTQRGASREEIEEGMQKIYEIQQALGYITVERQKLAQGGSFIDRVISFVKNLRKKFNKKSDDSEKEVIHALMQIEYV